MGDARGRWDGDTLVVETTNFNGTIGVTGNGRLRPASDAMRVTERFTRTGPTPSSTGHGDRSQDVDRAVDGVVPAQARTTPTASTSTRATKATTRCATS
jgi:hypothetical protein